MSSATELGNPSVIEDAEVNLSEMRRLYDVQRAAATSSLDLRARLETLRSLSDLLGRNGPAIAEAISADFGNRSPYETFLLELIPVQNAIRHARKNLAKWMRPERRRVATIFKPAKAWIQYQPLGVVGIISPWNYPLSLAILPAVDALAAGNRVLLKPPELAPRFSSLLKRLLAEVFPEAELAVVLGGPKIAEEFCRLPLDSLAFTGSTAVGRRVMALAADNLTPVTLELGGKSPALVCPDYHPRAAARDIAFSKFSNSGQTCIAPDYVLVPEAKVTTFAEAVISEAERLYPTIATNPNYASIISDGHYDRLHRSIEEARAGGAEIFTHRDQAAGRQRKIEPTVVLHPPTECELMREEIFGPVLPILGYKTLEEAIAFINAKERPLALYCMTHNREYRDAVLQHTISGGVTLNGTFLHIAQEDLPFGGVGKSGMGSYHGIAGFRRFSHARSIHQVRFLNVLHFLSPPYTWVCRQVIRWLGSRRAADSIRN
jgi:coniferyl-aldehyde dehydrogenase